MRAVAKAAVAGLMVVLVAGCGGDDLSEKASEKVGEKAIEKAIEQGAEEEGVDVDIDGDKVTVDGEDGSMTMGGTDVPENFPDDLELPDGEITYAMDSPQSSMVTMTVDDLDATFEALVADLEGKGWKNNLNMDSEGVKMATLSKDDTTGITIQADSGSGDLVVMSSVG